MLPLIMRIWHVQLMNRSTFWSRVEVGSLCQVFVTVKNIYKISSETVREPVAAVSSLSRGKVMELLPHIKENYCNEARSLIVGT